MLNVIFENWGTILVGGLITVGVALVIVKLYRDRKKGRSSCGCGCGSCPSAGVCHKK